MRRSPSAFTIIELVIAIGLGSLIMLAAFAAFRVGFQAMSACNRLAVGNALLRASFIYACDRIDAAQPSSGDLLPLIPASWPVASVTTNTTTVPISLLSYNEITSRDWAHVSYPFTSLTKPTTGTQGNGFNINIDRGTKTHGRSLIRLEDPITGGSSELRFSAIGTQVNFP